MPLILQNANQPIEFVSSGYEIEPDEEFTPHLRTHCNSGTTVAIKLESFFGAFYFGTDRKSAKSTVERTAISNEKMNQILASLRYTTFIFDGVNMQDYVQVTVTCGGSKQHKVIFPVLIRRRPAPQLFLSKSNSVKDKLTIVTKTYLRYPCLETLLDSIFEKYPGITVIVADDSPSREYQEIDKEKYPTVKQYKLPDSEGWFAGRGLAISQGKDLFFDEICQKKS
jgi:predicted regulator of amino acid metabolism with ACT domain